MIGEKIIASYKNGNYKVLITDSGTKIRYGDVDVFAPEFPETIDVCISKKCEQGCAFCYVNCTPEGAIADFNHPLFDSIPPYVELALNGNGLENNEEFKQFLYRMRERKIICNITYHLEQFEKNYSCIKYWHDNGLIHGVGISVNQIPTDYQLTLLRSNSDFIVHMVAGIVPFEAITKMYDCGIKVLVLGYKNCGRGRVYAEIHPDIRARIAQFEVLLDEMKSHFKLISFDNLALKQLNMRAHITEEDWRAHYMGEDGHFSMYLDMVDCGFACSSLAETIPIFSSDIRDLFKKVRENNVD